MSSKNGSSKGTATRETHNAKTGRMSEKASAAQAAGSYTRGDAKNGSVADKKMLRAWCTISANRGESKRKR
jgi:hypothetical protein